MILKRFFFILCFIIIVSEISAQKMNGVSYVASGDSISLTHIKPVLSVNANYASLMPFGFIKNLNFPKVIFDTERQWFGESERGVRQYAKALQKVGIKLMIKPQIWVWRGEYTGQIEMTTEKDWGTLEESYESFILTYANTARAVNAEVFCIGTELEKFVANRPEFWKSLIEKVRRVYKGKITYAANWDEYKRTPFWNLLDYIGIDAYFPLSDKKSPTVKEFETGWIPHKKEIKSIQQKFDKPILFTEFGYRSVFFTGKEPWDSTRKEGEIDLQAQANGLQAIYNQFWNEDWFAGGFLWKWFIKHDRVGGKNNNQFTLQNKPAEALLKQLYKAH